MIPGLMFIASHALGHTQSGALIGNTFSVVAQLCHLLLFPVVPFPVVHIVKMKVTQRLNITVIHILIMKVIQKLNISVK